MDPGFRRDDEKQNNYQANAHGVPDPLVRKHDLYQRLGRTDLDPPIEAAVLGCDLPANDERADYLRATFARAPDGRLVASPFARQDSSMVAVLAQADGLLLRAPHAAAARAGEPCTIVKFDR